MKDAHLTLRLANAVAKALARRARELGVPKSQLAREAVARYVSASPVVAAAGVPARELAARWVGIPSLSPEEATGLAEDIAAARASLPAPTSAWE